MKTSLLNRINQLLIEEEECIRGGKFEEIDGIINLKAKLLFELHSFWGQQPKDYDHAVTREFVLSVIERLDRNAILIKTQMEVVKSLADIATNAIRTVDDDGTYSV